MAEDFLANPESRLEKAYTRIWTTRMAGLPFLNDKLRVEAVGFRPWDGEWLGALVTPWSLNLVLLPGEGQWKALPAGGERIVALPAGRYRFIAGVDADLGEYHACSLFSPTQEFADHESARATAAAALVALFDAANAAADDAFLAEHKPAPAQPAEVSKRNFLRGQFSGSGHGDRG